MNVSCNSYSARKIRRQLKIPAKWYFLMLKHTFTRTQRSIFSGKIYLPMQVPAYIGIKLCSRARKDH